MAIQSLLLGVVALAGSAIAAPAAAIKTATPTPTLTNAQVHAPAITADVAAGVVDKRAAACTFSGSKSPCRDQAVEFINHLVYCPLYYRFCLLHIVPKSMPLASL